MRPPSTRFFMFAFKPENLCATTHKSCETYTQSSDVIHAHKVPVLNVHTCSIARKACPKLTVRRCPCCAAGSRPPGTTGTPRPSLCLCSSAWRARRTKDGAPQSQASPPVSSAIHGSPSKFLEPISTFNLESVKTRNSFGYGSRERHFCLFRAGIIPLFSFF